MAVWSGRPAAEHFADVMQNSWFDLVNQFSYQSVPFAAATDVRWIEHERSGSPCLATGLSLGGS